MSKSQIQTKREIEKNAIIAIIKGYKQRSIFGRKIPQIEELGYFRVKESVDPGINIPENLRDDLRRRLIVVESFSRIDFERICYEMGL